MDIALLMSKPGYNYPARHTALQLRTIPSIRAPGAGVGFPAGIYLPIWTK